MTTTEVFISNNFYNQALQPNANALRKTMTKAEACLWKYVLRARGMRGYQFRRQRPILKYIVDFVCLELKLVIEVDGSSHNHEDIFRKDGKRQKDLEKNGFRVLRFTDEEVLKQIRGVNESIESVIYELEQSSPQPPSKGRQRSENG